jgi:hypothetical protein
MKSSLLVIAVGLVAGAGGMAFADGSGSDATAPAAPDAGTPATVAPGGWMQLDSRPLTIPTGKLAVDGLLPLFGIGDGNDTQFGAALQLSGTYGVNDKLEVGADFSLALSPDFQANTLSGRAAYLLLHQDKLDFAAAASLTVGLSDSNVFELDVGAWLRYRIAPKMMLFTGEPTTLPLPSLGLGVIGGYLLGPIPYQFGIGFNDGTPINFSLPVGFGYQATPNVWVYGQVVLLDVLSFGNTSYTDILFRDIIPITIGGYYTISDKMEAGLSLGDDLENAGDLYAFTFNFRYWVK